MKINFGIKVLKYHNLKNLKEQAFKNINQQQRAEQKLPSKVLFEVTDDYKAYAYMPRNNG
ncbi:hypothetical protein GPDM_15039 [Planococcus donghaensis MPA1U2]|uniref:Uncharacterized protein n=1 Tax=Planococcus donghaensis MPA1U2 TaxID=933115 RepID=E7RKI3_9BACL|nr:hypothetical protein [Planococcus donghaensis]EGA88413.1 hypothetical protein GPDM_15039 [Planococcus donghaensis MPA1U2]